MKANNYNKITEKRCTYIVKNVINSHSYKKEILNQFKYLIAKNERYKHELNMS